VYAAVSHSPQSCQKKFINEIWATERQPFFFLKVAGGLEAFVEPSFVPLRGLYPHFAFADITRAEQWVTTCRLQWDGNSLYIYPKRRLSIGTATGLPFVGRDTLVEALKEKLQNEALAVVAGKCGVGKSTLINAYVNRWGATLYSPQFQWKINAAEFHESYTEIAQLLGLKEAAEMREWLRDKKGWLMVVEDVNDISLFSGYFPAQIGGHLIFSSSHPQGAGAIYLNPLKEQEAIELLQVTTQFKNSEGADRLAKELGCLPSALVEVGNYLKGSATSYQLFSSSFMEQIKWQDVTPQTWKKWATILLDLQNNSPEAFKLLAEIALLGQNNIPKEVFLSETSDLPLLNSLLIQLSKYFLIFPGELVETISIHPMIQKIVRQFLGGEEKTVIETLFQKLLSKWNFDEEKQTPPRITIPSLDSASFALCRSCLFIWRG